MASGHLGLCVTEVATANEGPFEEICHRSGARSYRQPAPQRKRSIRTGSAHQVDVFSFSKPPKAPRYSAAAEALWVEGRVACWTAEREQLRPSKEEEAADRAEQERAARVEREAAGVEADRLVADRLAARAGAVGLCPSLAQQAWCALREGRPPPEQQCDPREGPVLAEWLEDMLEA